MLKCVETMQKINMQCDPIALAKRYTQCAPINLALCPTAIHSKSHPTVRHSKPRPTVRHSKPPTPPCHHTGFGGIINPLCGTRHTWCISKIYKNLDIANRSCVSYTQYVEGIYDNPVTLKSRLRVTQGHWNWCYSKAWVWFPIRLL